MSVSPSPSKGEPLLRGLPVGHTLRSAAAAAVDTSALMSGQRPAGITTPSPHGSFSRPSSASQGGSKGGSKAHQGGMGKLKLASAPLSSKQHG